MKRDLFLAEKSSKSVLPSWESSFAGDFVENRRSIVNLQNMHFSQHVRILSTKHDIKHFETGLTPI